MTDSKWCDGHEGRIRSRAGRVDVNDTYQFCIACHQKIRRDNLEPGEDFEVGELWSRSQEDADGE